MLAHPFPSLPDGFEPTRGALHAYAKALGTLPQTHISKHPKWWHISLKVRAGGLAIENIALPGGGILGGRLDLRSHEIVLETSRGDAAMFAMTEGTSGSDMADRLIEHVRGYGLEGDYVRKDFESHEPTTYDRSHAERYWWVLVNVANVFAAHRARIGGNVGPLQFWPHGFDLAFEWFGTKQVEYEGAMLAAQLNLGFYVTGSQYFYSVPWPMEPSLLEGPAPAPGRWTSETFSGAILDYADVADRPDGDEMLEQFARSAFDLAGPTLLD